MTTHTIMKTVKVLYIEDDDSSAKLLLEYLKRSRHTYFEVIRLSNLKDALSFLENECFIDDCPTIDVILLDLILPNSHGINTYKKIRQLCGDIPVVIVSGHEDLAIECVRLGAQDYIVKPNFTMEMLCRSLRYAIERYHLTKEKIRTENKFSAVINSTPIGFHNYVLENDKLILDSFNPAADKILNINHSDLKGKTLEEAFPGLKTTSIPQIYKEIALGKRKYFTEVRCYEDDKIGRAFFRVNSFPTEKNCLTVTFEDITEQLMTANSFKNIIEVTNAGIFEIDYLKRKFKYVNDKFCEMSGYSKEEILNLDPSRLLTNKSLNDWLERLEALKNGEYISKVVEYEGITKTGEKRWYLLTSEFIESSTGKVIGANVVVIDITEQKKAKEELKKKEEYLFNELEERIHQWRDELSLNVKQNNISQKYTEV